jgi:hypothetical protein
LAAGTLKPTAIDLGSWCYYVCMPPFDPRLWNLVPAALLLTSACQTAPSIPAGETETGGSTSDGDGDGDPTGDGDGDGDGDPTGDGDGDGDPTGDGNPYACGDDCGPHEYCDEGSCWTIFECYDPLDCDPGEDCNYELFYQPCKPLDPAPECNPPALVEIPLPDAAQGPVLDMHFADLDGDGLDELLLLHPGELLVVDDDQSVSSSAVDPLSEAFAVVRADADPLLDVILTSGQPDHGGRLIGVGDGTFADVTSLALPALTQPQALDWLGGDAQELAVLDPDIGAVMMLSQLADDPPIVDPFPVMEFVNSDLDAIHVGKVDVDMIDEVILQRDCALSYQGTDVALPQNEFLWSGQQCRTYLEPFGGKVQLVTTTDTQGGDTDLRMFWGFGKYSGGALIPGSITDAVNVEGLGLVLAGPDTTRLLTPQFEPQFEPTGCISTLESAPPATRVAAGNFTGDADHEFVLLGQDDQLSMWAGP